jgi:putative membrane protein
MSDLEAKPPPAPVIFADARGTALPAEPTPELPSAAPAKPRARWGWRLLLASLAALIVVALGFDAWDLLRRAWEANSVLGALVAALVILAVIGLLKLIVDELRALLRLGRIDDLRARASLMLNSDAHSGGQGFSAEIDALYVGRADLAPQLAALRRARAEPHDDHEIVRLADRELMQPIDRAAYQEVLRASRDAALATAVSPSALLDVLLMLWRSLRLIRRIGQLYGARPGALATIRLLKRAAANALLAGGMETGDSLVTEALGGSVVAAVSARISQGLLNGLLTARLGLAAMDGCRPIPFSAANRPSLAEIRRSLLLVTKQSASQP